MFNIKKILTFAKSAEEFKNNYVYKEVDSDELYSKLVCALLHNISACDKCKKCGEDSPECRMKLVEKLARFMGKDVPWER